MQLRAALQTLPSGTVSGRVVKTELQHLVSEGHLRPGGRLPAPPPQPERVMISPPPRNVRVETGGQLHPSQMFTEMCAPMLTEMCAQPGRTYP